MKIKMCSAISISLVPMLLLLVSLLSCKSSSNQSEVPRGEGRPSAAQLIGELDSNNDKKLSKAEVNGPLLDDFSKLDANGDGYLTENELESIPNRPGRRIKNERESDVVVDKNVKAIPVNTAYFIQENIIGGIVQEQINLSGIVTLCNVIKTHSRASEHNMGPWCPREVSDEKSEGGIWFEGGKVYDVSGHFISHLDEFYKDNKWKLYNKDGSIRVTDTKEGCLAAAKPNVEVQYQNYCVECLPDYFKDQLTTYVIPVLPQYITTPQSLGRGGVGVAFNGVKFDPPAPTHAILAAHTIAPLDDHGGHVNPHGGYHYHALTGSTKEVAQTDAHAPMIGYAIDGFGIYALTDKNGNIPADLDECGGHTDDIRGYHYHAGAPGDNQIIKCLHGLPGYTEVKE